MSARRSTSSPAICSGAMKSAVPTSSPVPVTVSPPPVVRLIPKSVR